MTRLAFRLEPDAVPAPAREFVARANAVLSERPLEILEDLRPFGCHVIAGLPVDQAFIESAKPAAVLVPVVIRDSGLTVLLTERAAHLNTHAGQVAFPGGRIDPGEGALAAALREAQEEIGLDPAVVSPLGFLPPYFSGTGFRVQPLVALVPPEVSLSPNPDEVGRIFEVSLKRVLDLAQYRQSTIFWRGKERTFYILDYPDAYIWGVTAGILRSFAERY